MTSEEKALLAERDKQWLQALNNWMPDDRQISWTTFGESDCPTELIDSLFQNGTLQKRQFNQFGQHTIAVD